MTDTIIGIDISKDQLDVHRLPDNTSRQFENAKAGHGALISWIGTGQVRVVYEATGPYHRQLEVALAGAGLPIVKVNPRQARRFAEATGKLAKTDRLDAAMLARMGALLAFEPRSVRNAILNDLKDLQVAREALVKDRTAARNRAKTLALPLLKSQNKARLDQIDEQLAALDQAISELIASDPVLSRRLAILSSIPGVAAVSAAMLITEMPELGSLGAKQAAALAGLAPIVRQSGQWKGKAFVRGGRKQVRRALYMPALVAMRFNPDLKAKYVQLVAAGKAPKQAITAIMRKLIVLANALIKTDRLWQNRMA